MNLKLRSWVLVIALVSAPHKLVGGYMIPTVIYSTYESKKKTVRLSKTELQRIFTRKITRWSNGDEITVYIKPIGSIEHRSFVAAVLGMTLYRYSKSLEVNTYTANAITVMEVRTDTAMRAAVHSNPGAIGYLNYTDPDGESTVTVCTTETECVGS